MLKHRPLLHLQAMSTGTVSLSCHSFAALGCSLADAVVRMLQFNAAAGPGSGPSSAGSAHSQQQQQQNGRDETYKVLVLDSFTKDIIAPLLKVRAALQMQTTRLCVLGAKRGAKRGAGLVAPLHQSVRVDFLHRSVQPG